MISFSRSLSARHGLRALVLSLALIGAVSSVNAQAIRTFPVTQVRGTYIDYTKGGLPIVLSCGHDGAVAPKSIPDREEGVTVRDGGTKDLTDAIAMALKSRTGKLPYIVMSNLSRKKMDPNRDAKEAAAGNPDALKAWQAYHDSIDEACKEAIKTYGFAFLIDVHAHGHPNPRLEIGLGLSLAALNKDDDGLNDTPVHPDFTLNDILASKGAPKIAELVRGPLGIGTLYANKGIPATPSAQDPHPGTGVYFNGAYTIRHHTGGDYMKKVDGFQVETNRKGVRDSVESKINFGEVTVEVLNEFLKAHYNYKLLPGASK